MATSIGFIEVGRELLTGYAARANCVHRVQDCIEPVLRRFWSIFRRWPRVFAHHLHVDSGETKKVTLFVTVEVQPNVAHRNIPLFVHGNKNNLKG